MNRMELHNRASAGRARMAATSSATPCALAILLVAVEARRSRGRSGDRALPQSPPGAPGRRELPADLELEIAVAPGRDHFFQRFRQAVVHPFGQVGRGDGIHHPDRVSRFRWRRRVAGRPRKRSKSKAPNSGRAAPMPARLGAHGGGKRNIRAATQGVEHRRSTRAGP